MNDNIYPIKYCSLSINNPDDLIFGRAPFPVICGHGLTIGSGEVYPEINFTLPVMELSGATWREVRAHYVQISEMVVRGAKRLKLPGLVVEFELLPPMTERPEWGAEITKILSDHLSGAHENFGLRSALRVTITDIRDAVRPPILRTGKYWECMKQSLEMCAQAGADILSIESIGGKEVHDAALMYGDVAGIIFSLGVLAPRDMQFLWTEITSIARKHEIIAGGDSACGFANTAMQLAGQGMLPEVLATVDRAASAVRSLVAFEQGASGPSKDCAYEGPVIKAITGTPISMEGKSACCAHFSPVGNIAAAFCDLWSNESVQNIRLLSGYAPEAFLELLAYDCRLFNQALSMGIERMYRGMLVESDVHLSPQALILSPESTIRIAKAIVGETTHYRQTVAASREAVSIIREAVKDETDLLSARERGFLERIEQGLEELPEDEGELLKTLQDTYRNLFLNEGYGL